jgi:succinate-acetate transporter protein
MTHSMSTRAADANGAAVGAAPNGRALDHEALRTVWEERSRVVLTPVAAPSILRLFGFFSATLLVGSNMAGWWGNHTTTSLRIFPFAIMLGGVAQFLAGMWAYKARDGVATAAHGIWGAFWLAWGLYQLLVSTGNLPAVIGDHNPAFGFWFIPLAMITFSCMLGAMRDNGGLVAVLGTLSVGSGFVAAGFIGGFHWPTVVGGWLFVFSAGFAWYAATAMMLEGAFRRTVLPSLKWNKDANVPTRMMVYPIEYPDGMPGVRVGQ